ncbi:MAG: cyclodeaminase/cyclohydrolase family protein [Oscillospiraceae bacterium]|jgi:formiminotetrahydrofolate cyclodeaminase|nr:cyclodeaminase/cyclohydrolase family protein [Oscillospiraceae bacterium]
MSFAEMSAQSFTGALSSSEPVPGGGGACALAGALGASLAAMVGNLTAGKKKYAEYERDIQRILKDAERLRLALLALIDRDAECFAPLSRAYGLTRDNPARDALMEDALKLACTVPVEIMRCAAEAIALHAELAVKGSALMLSDVGVGVLCCKTALMGASLNVLTNVRLMKDLSFAGALRDRCGALIAEHGAAADRCYAAVLQKLS